MNNLNTPNMKMNTNTGRKQCLGCMEFYDSSMDICPFCGYADGQTERELLHICPGEILTDRYIIGRVLGYGGFGVTYIGWDIQLKRKVAIKEYFPSEFATRVIQRQDLLVANNEKKHKQFTDGMHKFLKEGEKLARVGNIDGIVYMYDCFEANNTAYIVMEYLEGETLASYLEREGPVSEQDAMEMIMPIMQALEIVHEKGIIHRDIAPDNIFLSVDGKGGLSVKLIDFGAAKFATTSHSKSLTVIIKPGYSPEEQYRSDGSQGTYTDVYAIAATMYTMVTGVQPPDAFERRTFIENKKKDLLEEPAKYNKNLSANFQNAILNAMNVKIEDRTATMVDFENELISFEPVKRRGSSIRKIDFMKWPLWAKIGVPVGGVVAIALIVVVIRWVFSSPDLIYTLPEGMTRVPDFVTVDFEEAQQWAEEECLVIGSSGSEYSPNTDSNLILSQDVAVGSIVVENTAINVIISTGEEIYQIPDVRGLHLEDAKARLECMGLEVLVEESVVAGLSDHGVIAQSLEPYTEVKTGDSVTLTVVAQAVNFGGEVPEFTGKSYDDALTTAADAGIVVVIKDKVFTNEYDDYEVMAQSCEAGDTVSQNGIIELTVALEEHEFAMPNLLYKNQETALLLLDNIGVEASVTEEISEVIAKGLVAQQSVEKDMVVQSGDSVGLTISKGSKPFAMPDVVGKTEEEARTGLRDCSLAVNVEYGYEEGAAEGIVISQSIEKNADVTRGTAITIVVCSMEGLVEVENVQGLSATGAKERLQAQGLTVHVDYIYSETVAEGVVINQMPRGGSVQKEGSTIVVSVSKGRDPEIVKAEEEKRLREEEEERQRQEEEERQRQEEEERQRQEEAANKTELVWSGWETSAPSNAVQVESKVQYSYRVKETTSSTDSNLAGWTLYDTQTAWGEYGAWSDWSEAAPVASESVKVESKMQYQSRSQVIVGYTYDTVFSGFVYDMGSIAVCAVHEPHCEVGCFRRWYMSDEHPGKCAGDVVTAVHPQYAWGEWSGWSDTQVPGEEEQTRTLYRSCTREPVYTYYYERWGAWSGWSDTPVSASANIEVQTQTLYRYATEVKVQ